MKNTTAALLTALGLALPATTFGQTNDQASAPAAKRSTPRKMAGSDEARPAKPASQRPPSTPRVIAFVDANHDGMLDSDEIAKASECLRSLDKNGDGSLTTEELRPQRPNRPRPMPAVAAERGSAEPAQRPTPRGRLGAIDANHDGVIDATEISSASHVLAKLDKDGDGKVTPDEARSQRSVTPRATRPSDRASKE